jgi:dipeptidyl aminopeptidase/acylaminoacyl peptidase
MKRTFFALCALFVFSFAVLAQTKQAEKYTIEQYLNIRSASAPSFSPKGDRIAYLTNKTGTSQVWIIPTAGGESKQLTNYEDNVGFAAFSPTDEAIVFGKASGGDENTQFFWMKSDGSEVKPLTNDPKVRHNFGEWSDDGKRIFYSSNKRDRNYFDIYAMDIPSGKEELILQHDGSNNVAAVSKDGKKVIVSRSGTELSLDNDLYLVEVDTKKVTHLTPHEGAALFGDVHFLPKPVVNTLIFTSNAKCEFNEFHSLILSFKDSPILSNCEKNADVDSIEISDNGTMIAHTVNREGASELYITPFKVEKVSVKIGEVNAKPVQSPSILLPGKGVVGGLDFSKDGKQLAFSFSGAKFNSDIWLYDVKSKSLKQLTNSDRAGIAQESFVEPQLIKYKSFDGREIPAWFYKRENVGQFTTKIEGRNVDGAVKLPLPVIVSVHGGPEAQERPGFNALYQYYLSRGYAVLATNVRGSTGYGKTFYSLDDVKKREDSVKDLAFAAEWLKTSGGADPKRIAVIGGSYGGYMTMAAITLYPDLWAAAVNTVGIVNFETFLQRTSSYRRRP